MIGQFLSEKIPAVGFSIGFEKIVSILMDNDDRIRSDMKKTAVIYKTEDNIIEVIRFADRLREKGIDVSIMVRKKKLGRQIQELRVEGYDSVYVYGEREDKMLLE